MHLGAQSGANESHVTAALVAFDHFDHEAEKVGATNLKVDRVANGAFKFMCKDIHLNFHSVRGPYLARSSVSLSVRPMPYRLYMGWKLRIE